MKRLFASVIMLSMIMIGITVEASDYDCELTIDASEHDEGNPAFPTDGCEDTPALGWFDGQEFMLSSFSGMATVTNGEIIDLGMETYVKVVINEKESKSKKESKSEDKTKSKQSSSSKKSSKNKDEKDESKSDQQAVAKKYQAKQASSEKKDKHLTTDELKEQDALDIEKRDNKYFAVYKDKMGETKEQAISEEEAEELGYEEETEEEVVDVMKEDEDKNSNTTTLVFIIGGVLIIVAVVAMTLLKRKRKVS